MIEGVKKTHYRILKPLGDSVLFASLRRRKFVVVGYP